MKPRDRIAFVIATGLIGWGLFAIIGATLHGKNLAEAGGEILGLIAGGLSASLAAYFTRNGEPPK
jgi:hypothetical protein